LFGDGLEPEQATESPSAKMFKKDYPESRNEVVKVKILAHAVSTWQSYAAKFKELKRFCDLRNIELLD
jgi:hypothetical protein